jgi:hypothetical protein
LIGQSCYYSVSPLFNDLRIPVKRILLPYAAVVTILVIAACVLMRGGADPSQPGLAGSEHGEGRAEWELMQLRDPATGRIPDDIRRRELAFAATLPTRDAHPMLSKTGRVAAYEWMPRGPVNIGGRTRALAIDVTGEDTILAAGVSGGLWRSTTAGASWRRMTLPTQLPAITTIVQDVRPGKTSRWYYGTGELSGNSASGGDAYYNGDGLFKSIDNGVTWTPLTATASGTPHVFDKVFDFTWRLALDPSKTDDHVYAALYGTIARSTNGGGAWRQVLGGQPPNGQRYSYYTDIAVTPTGVAYATLSSEGWKPGIYRSTDGLAWTQIAPPDMPAKYNRIVMGISPQNENVVYFLGETPGTGHLGRNFRGDSSWQHLWRYTYLSGKGDSAGGRWEDLTASLPSFGPPHGDFFTQGSYDMLVEVDPFDSNMVVIGGTNLFRSDDGFRTSSATRWIGGYQNSVFDSTVFVDLEYPNHHPDLHRAIFSRTRPNVLFTGSDGGVHRTDAVRADSVTWSPLNTGYTTTQFYSVAIDRATAGDPTVVGGMQDNGTSITRSTSASAPWLRVGSGDGSYAAFADGGTSLYVSKQLGKTYRVVLDAAGNTVQSTRVDPAGVKKYLFINPFILDPADTRMMYLAGGNELWRNSDLTAIAMASTQPATTNWTRMSKTAVADSVYITAIAASKSAPAHRLYYGTSLGAVYRIDDASTGDPEPTVITGTAFPRDAYVSCIAVDPENADNVIVVFSNYSVQSLFSSTDGGTTWTPIGGNLEATKTGAGAGPSCRWVSILHRPNETVWLVGTSTGLYSTTHLAGMTTEWTHEAPSTLGNAIVTMIDVRQSDGFVAVATHGLGVWTTTIDLAGVEAPLGSTGGLDLSIAPNPVTGPATIRFKVPAGGAHVRARLFDTRGALLGTLHDAPMPGGAAAVAIDPRDLGAASGMTFVRLEVGSAIETRSITVHRP